MFRLITVVFTVLVLAVSCTTVMAEETNPEVRALLDQGWEHVKLMHIDLGNLDKAEALFAKALEIKPDSVEANWRMAEVLFKIADNKPMSEDETTATFVKGLDYAGKSLELEPDNAGGLFWSGCINGQMARRVGVLKALGKVKAAKKDLHTLVEKYPDHRYATISYAILGAIYSSTPWPMKDMDKALEFGQTAVKRDPKLSFASVELAMVYIKDDQYDKARAELNRCLEVKDPTYIWDSTLKNWPKAKQLLEEIKDK
ncbi:TPR repeat-containing protein [Desulfatibacillum aliphaticivorans]|uniref:TPR repeat-containing protein n=1 Tax=Desulfatibacillum aliphaticivorans TaxID=218208 RepID=B8FKS1_DESAL|nr:tetratricopeptide repeat protein [Desulfatibacillum aliphaticivorans]ACL04443.1 TPR repeat-containing protein [Desulfatibacillum aliphaticivorans]